ncbi:MAG TPA: T9SS type A sorting domain-containing protein, partial [Rubricoccaceae bacterium]
WPIARFHSGTHSIALGGATTGAASWTQSEVVRNWVDKVAANTSFSARAWVYTEGVNVNPTSDAGKYQMVLTFRNAAGAVIGGGDLVTDVPQTASGTNGWVQMQSQSVALPEDAVSVTAVVRRGASATGTVWFDDFAFIKDDNNTLTSWHGSNVDLSGEWYTYWPGFDSSVATPGWVVGKTVAQQHTGAASLRVQRLGAPSTTSPEEAVAISPRIPVTVGQPMLISYWLKTEGHLNPSAIGTGESSATTDNNVGIVAISYDRLVGGRNGYGELGGDDIRLNGAYNPRVIPLLPQQADNGWTNYAFVVYPRPNAVAMETRLRYYHQFSGTTYWDDIALTNISGANLFNPVAGEDAPAPGAPGASAQQWFRANQPNPFADQTEIRFALPQAEAVTLEVYDLLGRRVALLADDAQMQSGEQTVAFERGQLPSGTYLVVLRTPSHSEARQITVVR